VPELPEVHALTSYLDERIAGRKVERCELASFSALKTVDPPLQSLVGRTASSCQRRGKYLCFDIDGVWLVIHLSRGGWVKWYDQLPAARPRPGKGPMQLRMGFEGGGGFDVTEMGKEKRLAIWVVDDPNRIENVATLGVDPLTPEFDVDALARLLAGNGATLKTVLTSQSLIAGVGNAYSDEALHAARLSPYKKSSNLTPDEVATLHDALVSVLSEALKRAEGLGASELKGDKKQGMAVHGRTGEVCPTCGDTIRQVSFSSKSMQYCPTCQTGGKPLADRRLSKLLK
jgi:formamidopyrimidine-DNA glycosylase